LLCLCLTCGQWGALTGCQRGNVEPIEGRELAAKKVAAPAPGPEPLFDVQGRLLPSGRHLEWLELPRGFEETPRSLPRRHEFEAKGVSVEQTRAYLSERMFTGQVDTLGEGFIYRAVMPLSGARDAARFDIRVMPKEQGKVVVLGIDTLGYPGAEALPLSEARRLLEQERARAE
jgi:hypothetical protein